MIEGRWPGRVRLVEVGPRDGLQNEPGVVPAGTRLGYVERLAAAGLADIEVGSFVHPKWVPQMAATDELLPRLPHLPGVRWWVLVPNRRGLQRAIEAGARHVAFVLSASEAHARANLNKGLDDAAAEVVALAAEAAAAGLPWRGYVSVAFGCPYEGAVDPARVLALAGRLLEAGAVEVSLGDTVGLGSPGPVAALARAAIDALGAERVAFHFHDTRGLGLVNALAALGEGALVLDGSAGGIGGCPYAPGASGNLATEELVALLDGLGIAHGANLEGIVAAAAWLEDEAGVKGASKLYRYNRSRKTNR